MASVKVKKQTTADEGDRVRVQHVVTDIVLRSITVMYKDDGSVCDWDIRKS
jgi:hypothetical protein